ncbi:NEDD8-specific protease 1 [Ricinus communis]|uniref:Sentrin/sumo-specific protease, senp8, putative n=1 Tax=Ricinus communis TaxID=3988 RepID=B9T1Y6_RICCO|nr:NEDD8-specific protease 1 [Ricinus communis]EEF30121.1 sentrin/sumo-specific protease, senp8, putative [Ricinus communis]|eukprot:XP_002532255.1 NEDD8-specific protease 1 [Ricinus communis]
MGKSGADEKILSYNDVVLRRSDLDILNGPYFLNDRIIEFYFSYLSSSHPSEDIILLSPSVAFWISNCLDTESLKDFLEPLKLPDKKLVMFPVNNNEDVNLAEGGSHWSLLVYERSCNVFVHHDSYSGTNKRHALQLYKAVARYIGTSDATAHAKYMDLNDSPQQVNGYDCGLYVTAIAGAICYWNESCDRKERDCLWFSVVKEQVTPAAVAAMRTEILSLIRSLMVSK